jgi:hypothetical protein
MEAERSGRVADWVADYERIKALSGISPHSIPAASMKPALSGRYLQPPGEHLNAHPRQGRELRHRENLHRALYDEGHPT